MADWQLHRRRRCRSITRWASASSTNCENEATTRCSGGCRATSRPPTVAVVRDGYNYWLLHGPTHAMQVSSAVSENEAFPRNAAVLIERVYL